MTENRTLFTDFIFQFSPLIKLRLYSNKKWPALKSIYLTIKNCDKTSAKAKASVIVYSFRESHLPRLISKKFDYEHINNMPSYRLSFFEKRILCGGLKFSLPQKASPIEIQASFEKAYWRIEPLLEDANKKELASSTLRSIALNYIQPTSPNPPKALVKVLNRLKKRDDIVITKPDKFWGCSDGQTRMHPPTKRCFSRQHL